MKGFFLFFSFLFILNLNAMSQVDFEPYLKENQIFQNVNINQINNTNFYLINYINTPIYLVEEKESFFFITDKKLIEENYNLFFFKEIQEINEKIDRIYDLVILFNDSRNAKTSRGLLIEETWKKTLRVKGEPCYTLDDCYKDAMAIGGGSSALAVTTKQALLDFNLAIFKLDESMEILENLKNQEQIEQKLEKINESFILIDSATKKLQTSILRWPHGSVHTCIDCLGLVPEYIFDFNSYLNAKSIFNRIKNNYPNIIYSDKIIDEILENNIKANNLQQEFITKQQNDYLNILKNLEDKNKNLLNKLKQKENECMINLFNDYSFLKENKKIEKINLFFINLKEEIDNCLENINESYDLIQFIEDIKTQENQHLCLEIKQKIKEIDMSSLNEEQIKQKKQEIENFCKIQKQENENVFLMVLFLLILLFSFIIFKFKKRLFIDKYKNKIKTEYELKKNQEKEKQENDYLQKLINETDIINNDKKGDNI